MTREEQLACIKDRPCDVCKMRTEHGCNSWGCVFEQAPDDENSIDGREEPQKWIPIKTRPLSEKEKEYFVIDAEFIYDCDLPDDGETVLITDKWGNVDTDTFYRDDGCYFEDYSGEDDVVAWMPLPEGYKAERSEE